MFWELWSCFFCLFMLFLTDGMAGNRFMQITILVAEMNRINEENMKLKAMLKLISSKYNYLHKHIRSLVEQRKGVDGNQVYYSVLSG